MVFDVIDRFRNAVTLPLNNFFFPSKSAAAIIFLMERDRCQGRIRGRSNQRMVESEEVRIRGRSNQRKVKSDEGRIRGRSNQRKVESEEGQIRGRSNQRKVESEEGRIRGRSN